MKIGILGAGQLGRMLALAGYPLGLQFRFWDPNSKSPGFTLAESVCAPFSDLQAFERFTEGLGLVTYESENIPITCVEALSSRLPLHPSARALEVASDRWNEKKFLRHLSIPVPDFANIETAQDIDRAVQSIAFPALLKTRRLGYDGKGQTKISHADELRNVWEKWQKPACILESVVPFDRELSILGVRSPGGEFRTYPLTENRHCEGILHYSTAPASSKFSAQAEDYLQRIAESLSYVGVLALELFEARGCLLANEIAPRVHNSGHWTLEGCVTSQFENHLRAIAGLPLGSTRALGYSLMVNLIGESPALDSLLSIRDAHVYLYGKDPKPGRKLGHLTLLGDSPQELAERCQTLITSLPHA